MRSINFILNPNTKKATLFEVVRKVRLLNLIIVTNIFAALLHLLFGIFFHDYLILGFSLIAIAVFFIAYIFNYNHKINALSLLLVVFACVFVISFAYFVGDIGLENYYFAGIILMSFIFHDRPGVLFSIFCVMIVSFVCLQIMSHCEIQSTINPQNLHLLKYTNIGICVFIIYMIMVQYHKDLRKSLRIINSQNKELELKNQQISFQKANLEQSNEAKNKILSILAHDLKSPINTLKGTLDLLRHKALSESEQTKILGNLYEATNHTSDFIDQLLNWGKNQFEHQHTSISEFDLIELADKIVHLLNSQAQIKGIVIKREYEGEIIQASDMELIHISIRNLMCNAIKFTPLFGTIVLSIKQMKEEVMIRVSDTGTGISSENIDSLFSKKMITQHGTMEEKGTGLGLLLVKECVEKCMGSIQLESIPGFSTTFQIVVPLKLDAISLK